jgi:hypothetical protein
MPTEYGRFIREMNRLTIMRANNVPNKPDYVKLCKNRIKSGGYCMLEIQPITKIVSHDERISTVMTSLPANEPIKIILSGKTGVLIDEEAYNGLLETLRILQENPLIVQSLAERENGEFIDEGEIHNYV